METLSPEVETARVNTLRRYEILDTPPEEDFDRITRLAGHVFGVPFAFISFVEEDRQWNKSVFGAIQKEVPRKASFCSYIMRTGEMLVVEDARKDMRFATSTLVTRAPHIRFYAGAPLTSSNGHTLGALCVADSLPRAFDARERAILEDMARLVMDLLEARSDVRCYRTLVENAPDPIIIHSGTAILYGNQAAARLLGAEAARPFQGASMLDFIHPEDHGLIQARIRRLFGGKKLVSPIEARLVGPQGNVIHAEIHSVPTTYRGERAIQDVLRDVTERKREQAALVESDQRWRRLVEANPQPIFVHVNGKMVYVNAAVARLLKATSAEELTGRRITDFVAPEQHDTVYTRIQLFKEGRQDLGDMEYEISCMDGERRIVEATGIPILYEGEPAIQVILRDITGRKQYEAQLIQARQEAEEMSRIKSDFLANMSHEIRTPLTTIIGFADILSGMVTGEGEEFVEYIVRSSQRLMETLNSVLDLSQIASHSFRLTFHTFDVRARVTEAVKIFQNKAQAHGLQLLSELPAEPVTAELDVVAFDRILNNLISNAIKFTPQGTITVSVRGTDSHAEVRVTDTGIGISPEFLPHIFDEFRQESTGHERGYEGSGLGLAITWQLVQMMNGVIEVESEKDKGSTFTVRFPRGRVAYGLPNAPALRN